MGVAIGLCGALRIVGQDATAPSVRERLAMSDEGPPPRETAAHLAGCRLSLARNLGQPPGS